MGEVEWSASSSETNPMLGIGRQSKRQSIGIMWGLSRPTLAEGRSGGSSAGVSSWHGWQHLDWHTLRFIHIFPPELKVSVLMCNFNPTIGDKCSEEREGVNTGLQSCSCKS